MGRDETRRGAQATVGLAITVSVHVDNNENTESVFDGLLACLSTATTDADAQSCSTVGAGTSARRLTAAQSPTKATRNLQALDGSGVCEHGTQVTCRDGVHNGDEATTDVGGSCGFPTQSPTRVPTQLRGSSATTPAQTKLQCCKGYCATQCLITDEDRSCNGCDDERCLNGGNSCFGAYDNDTANDGQADGTYCDRTC